MNPFDELKGFDTYNNVMGHKEEFNKGTKMGRKQTDPLLTYF